MPGILVGDIDRGGVIASLVGSHAVLDPADRAMIRGFAVNRFRGAVELFQPGVETTTAATGWPCLGVVPWFGAAHRLPAEDGLDLHAERRADARIRIAVPILPGIANFDDLDPLKLEPTVDLAMVPPRQALPVCDVVILPGSKTTLRDLAALRSEGWDIDILAHRRRGGHVLGLCGGYQMLGRVVRDPEGLEGPAGEAPGLGLLDIETTLDSGKTVREVGFRHAPSATEGLAYEIHLGRTEGTDCRHAPFIVDGRPEGAASPDGRVAGTYLHGAFTSDAVRAAWLGAIMAFRGFQADLRTVPMDADGLEVEELERQLAAGTPKLLYTIPDHQNPAGVSMSTERRERLVELARRHGFLVVEDVAYRELGFDDEAPPTLWSLAPDVVVQAGTTSKTFFPGVRLGWAAAPAEISARLVSAKQNTDQCAGALGRQAHQRKVPAVVKRGH